MPDRLERALIDVLARIDAGSSVSADELRTAYPDCWEELRSVLELQERYRDARVFAADDASDAFAGGALAPVDPARYDGFRVLGRGGMGVVWWARDTRLRRPVAFKVVRVDTGPPGGPPGSGTAAPLDLVPPAAGAPGSLAFEALKSRFLREARVTAGLEHPGIAPVYEMGRTPEGLPFYTMRVVPGSRTLSDALAELRGRPVDERLRLLDVLLRVCDTVRYAHGRGVVHRDLKPANVALGEFGEVVVLDWGLARAETSPGGTGDPLPAGGSGGSAALTPARVLGTPGYMSPEAVKGRSAEVDARSDVYSLGAILFQVLTGRLPYVFETLADLVREMDAGPPPAASALDPSVPPGLSAIAARALSRDPAGRPADVADFAAEIRSWLDERARAIEVDALRREASAAMAAAEGLEGDALLRQLDRVHDATTRVLDRRADDATAARLAAEVDRRREEGVRQREHAARRRTLRRVGVASMAAALVGAAAFAWMLHDAQLRTSEEQDRRVSVTRRWRSLALTAASSSAEEFEPVRALLLAIEAVRAGPEPAAVDRLRRAIKACHERAVLAVPGHVVTSAEASPRGDRVLTTADDGRARIFDATGNALRVLAVEGAAILGAAFSPDGAAVLSTSSDGVARVWDVDSDRFVTIAAAPGRILRARWAPDGRRIVAVAHDGTVHVFGRDGALVARRKFPGAEDASAEASPDGGTVLVSTAAGEVALWDVAADAVADLRTPDGPTGPGSFSPDGRAVLTVSATGVLRTWDARGGFVAEMPSDGGTVTSAVFAPRDGLLLARCADGTLRVWDPGRGTVATIRDPEGVVVSSAFSTTNSADGRRVCIVTGSSLGEVRFWTPGGDALGRGEPDHAAEVCVAVASPTGGGCFTACGAGVVRVWSADRLRTAVLRGHAGRILGVSVAPLGGLVATWSADGTARVWSLDPAEPVEVGEEGPASAAASSGGGRRVTSEGTGDATVVSLSCATSGELPSIQSGAFDQSLVAPDGLHVVLWSEGGPARVWDVRAERIDDVPGGRCVGAGFGGGHVRIVTASGNDADVRDAAGNVVAPLRGHRLPVVAAAFSDDGLLVGTASRDKWACIWDARVGGPPLHILRGHDERLSRIAFAPGRECVATSADDRTARLWCWDSGEVASFVLPLGPGEVTRLSFSRSADSLATTFEGGRTLRWRVRSDDLLACAEACLSRDFSDDERKLFASLLDGTTRPPGRCRGAEAGEVTTAPAIAASPGPR